MKEPRFWHNSPSAPGLIPGLLSPLSLLWQMTARRRQQTANPLRLEVPVICVGNINIGGTGKTPTCIALLEMLKSMGANPHVVTRGYGGRETGPVLVKEGKHNAEQVGDEPLLLAAFGPVWVAKDRAMGGKAAVQAGADIILLDDGLQNPSLAKDYTITVVDAKVGFGNGRVMPSGPLRESVPDGLARTDLALILGKSTDAQSLLNDWPQMAKTKIQHARLKPLQTGIDWQDMPVLAFAGIGKPEKFFASLEEAGADILKSRGFDDHQALPLSLLHRLEAEARSLGAQLVTTEKDAVRLPASFRQNVLTFPVRLEFQDPSAMKDLLSGLWSKPANKSDV